MNKSILQEKSFAFAIRIVNMYRYMCDEKKEFVLSKQILRSGTSIGANVREAKRGQTNPDFYSKLTIALKEADETAYWLELLNQTGYLDNDMYESMHKDCEELIKILVSITKTLKNKESTKKDSEIRTPNSELS
ncbi:MAG: four helix bundle protein [Bacteroidales bacterium]|nr:four helix bundle protein [Bacteroidales bacterium]